MMRVEIFINSIKPTKPVMTRAFTLVMFVLLFSCSNQIERSYLKESPEIEIAKKADKAFGDRDWSTLRSLYSDSAKIFINSWWDKSMTPDEFVDRLQRAADTRLGYQIKDDALYEMIVKNNNEKWVYAWMNLDITYTNGVTGSTVNNRMWRIKNDKIVYFFTIYNGYPLYRARFDSIPSN